MLDAVCDANWRATLQTLSRDQLAPDRARRLDTLPIATRVDTLRTSGLLEPYIATLQQLVAARAAAVRQDARRFRPNLEFALFVDRAPADWLTLGLLEGFSTPREPALLWSTEPRLTDLLARARGRGVFVVPAVGLFPERLPPAAWGSAQLVRLALRENDGFWVPGTHLLGGGIRTPGGVIGSDSLAHLLRRFGKAALPVEPRDR